MILGENSGTAQFSTRSGGEKELIQVIGRTARGKEATRKSKMQVGG
jgi:hypothetical protein